MSLLTGVSDFFGLDIGTTAIRIAELKGGGPVKQLVNFAYAPIDTKVAMSDAKADQAKIMESLAELLTQSEMRSRNVAVGVPSTKVFTTVFDIDKLDKDDLAKSIRYQADSLIPTPVSESKLDWHVLGPSPKDPAKLEIILTSVTNEYIEARLDLLESMGLNVIAFEPDNIALARALIAPDAKLPQLVLHIDNNNTDVVLTLNGDARLTRALSVGTTTIIRALAQNLTIDDARAKELVFKFGLTKESLEGQVYNAIIGTVDLLSSDIEKSIRFFTARYNMPVEKIILSGSAAMIPNFGNYIANKFNVSVEIGNAWRNVTFANDKQSELLPLANSFGVAVGLAERDE